MRFIVYALLAVAAVSRAEIPVIENPATPAEGLQVVEAEELWRVGGYDEDYLFGTVEAAAIAADGTTYLLDTQLSEISAFDLEGNEIAKFGRAGEGPGEMDRGQAIMALDDGRVAVLNMRPPKIITYSAAGDPTGDLSLAGNEGMNFTSGAMSAGGRVVFQTKNVGFSEKTQTSSDAIRALDPATGDPLGVYLEQTEEKDRLGSGGNMVITIGDGFVSDWTVFDDGTLAIVRDDDVYEIEILDTEGNHLRTIRRAGERARRPQEDIDGDRKQRELLAERTGMSIDLGDIEEFEPMIESIHARPNGELWVLSGEGLAHDRDDVAGVFDVFDPDGRFVRQVELRAACDRSNDRFELQGNSLVVFEDLVAARGGGFIVMGSTITQEDDESDADPLAIARYRF